MVWTELKARNPWLKIPAFKPYFLDQDREAISHLNLRHRGLPTEVRVEVLPGPFIGTVEAPIWLLNLNPGFELADLTYNERVKAQQRESISLASDRFWMLSEENRATGAFRWWDGKFRSTINRYGRDRISRRFFCAELFPYHSERFHLRHHVPSQAFTFQLVREACLQGKSFIFMRARQAWLEAVPELRNARTTKLRNNRNPAISFGNIEDSSILTEVLA
ncbi:MAG: hypothetical protein ACYC0C_10710 [Devosia sp.]